VRTVLKREHFGLPPISGGQQREEPQVRVVRLQAEEAEIDGSEPLVSAPRRESGTVVPGFAPSGRALA